MSKEITRMKKYFNDNTPFAIMQYFESLKTSKQETNKKYELLYIDGKIVRYITLKQKELTFFNENIEKFVKVLDNKDGKVFEFNSFKEYKEKTQVYH